MSKLLEMSETFNILLVEDNVAHARLIQEALKTSGMPVKLISVRDGVEAMNYLNQVGEYAKSIRPDLVLLDLNLPRKTGHEVLEEAKTSPHLKQIPMIVLSTSNSPGDIEKAYSHHANCYLVKPRNIGHLFKVVERIQEFWLQTATLATGVV